MKSYWYALSTSIIGVSEAWLFSNFILFNRISLSQILTFRSKLTDSLLINLMNLLECSRRLRVLVFVRMDESNQSSVISL